MRFWWNYFWVRLLPKRLLTTLVGEFASRPASRVVIPWFVRHYQIDVAEAQYPLSAYKTWVEFFSRGLKDGARPLSNSLVLSPVDGKASSLGMITNRTLIQAKGKNYRVSELVFDSSLEERYVGGHYATLYLSPSNYHRVHMPFDGEIVKWTHIPGDLFPVNAAGVGTVNGLFARNERMVIEVETTLGHCAIVLVGAAIVGSIRTPFGPSHHSAIRRRKWSVQSADVSIYLNKGDELGYFAFGSTVILLFTAQPKLSFLVEEGDLLQMGQGLAVSLADE